MLSTQYLRIARLPFEQGTDTSALQSEGSAIQIASVGSHANALELYGLAVEH